MKSVVFLGPTLPVSDASKILEATYLPPVAQGDVLRAVREHPDTIAIIDGYFDRVPAVWHKEILWALTEGIQVFGAASMGALRAAELEAFGMKGVGKIFEAFHTGLLADDDEVAVAHGDESTGYRATSEAMVNIRETLRAAERCGVIDPSMREQLESIARRLFYPERSYSKLLAAAREAGVSNTTLDALRSFIATGRVDQKRADALTLLEILAADSPREDTGSPTFSFAYTEAWDQVVDWANAQPSIALSGALPPNLLAAEVRLAGLGGQPILQASFARSLAAVLANGSAPVDRSARFEKLDRSWRAIAATGSESDSSALGVWLTRQDMTPKAYVGFVEREAEAEWAREHYREQLDRHVAQELRVRGEYPRISRRARDKDAILTRHGLSTPSLEASGLDQSSLLSWYFAHVLQRDVPDDVDSFLCTVGLVDINALQVEALRELCYQRLAGIQMIPIELGGTQTYVADQRDPE